MHSEDSTSKEFDFDKFRSIQGIDTKLDYVFKYMHTSCQEGYFEEVDRAIKYFVDVVDNNEFDNNQYLGMLVTSRPWRDKLKNREALFNIMSKVIADPKIYAGLK